MATPEPAPAVVPAEAHAAADPQRTAGSKATPAPAQVPDQANAGGPAPDPERTAGRMAAPAPAAAPAIPALRAIDVHAHVGRYDRGEQRRQDRLMSGSAAQVAELARRANIAITVVSALEALMPFGGDPLGGNELAVAAVAEQPSLRFWAVLHPTVAGSYRQVEELLTHPACCGIKIHPDAHHYLISEHGAAIFGFAARQGAVVLTHSGDYGASPEDFVPFCDVHPELRLILAHLGHDPSSMHRQVYACRRARHGNVYVDTSSAKSIRSGLIEAAVADLGPGRLLFGTDTPLYFPPAQRARIDQALISDAAKRAILVDNAASLLGLQPAAEEGGSDGA